MDTERLPLERAAASVVPPDHGAFGALSTLIVVSAFSGLRPGAFAGSVTVIL